MLSEWSAACATDDPIIDVPWSSPDGDLRWVDLRTDPQALDEVTEADEYPALLAALRSLNVSRSPVYSSKCDVWEMEEEELSALRMEMLLEDDVAAAGVSCYIDLVFRERSLFASRHRSEQALHRMDRMLRELPHSLAAAECVLRHAVTDFGTVQEGYAFTLYVKGVGVDIYEANERWGAALRDAARLVRNLEPSTTRIRL